MDVLKKAVLIGAGKIGRGIIAKSLIGAGYSLTLLDVDEELIALLRAAKSYTVRSLDETTDYTETITGYQAYSIGSKEAQTAICNADIIFVSVGVNNLSALMRVVMCHLLKRVQTFRPPVDMVFCENIVGVSGRIENILKHELGVDTSIFQGKVGFSGGSVGVVVPPFTDSLHIVKGPYDDIHVEESALITKVRIPHFVPVSNFELCIREKLYIYNMAHALVSYIGWLFGYTYVDEAFASPRIILDARNAMRAVSNALSREYDVPVNSIIKEAEDIEKRICNKRIRDTVVRIGEDPVRKLGYNDRLVGAYRLTQKHGFACDAILKGIAAGFLFAVPGDEAAVKIQTSIIEHGICASVMAFTGITEDAAITKIVRYYNIFKNKSKNP